MTEYEEFFQKNGFRYKTEDEIRNAYDRQWKAAHGIVLTEEEFIAEEGCDEDRARVVYERLMELQQHMNVDAGLIYRFAKFSWCMTNPDAVRACKEIHGCEIINNCDTEISEEKAIVLINDEWGFEASGIKLIDEAFYESTDWQFIHFNCRGTSWLWAGEELHMVEDYFPERNKE